ncbi:MAG: hypothetical protein SGPRY_001516 [Prymnesium sp.]
MFSFLNGAAPLSQPAAPPSVLNGAGNDLFLSGGVACRGTAGGGVADGLSHPLPPNLLSPASAGVLANPLGSTPRSCSCAGAIGAVSSPGTKKVVKKTSKARKPGWASKEPDGLDAASTAERAPALDSEAGSSLSAAPPPQIASEKALVHPRFKAAFDAVDRSRSPPRCAGEVAPGSHLSAASASEVALERALGAGPTWRGGRGGMTNNCSRPPPGQPMLSDSDVAMAAPRETPANELTHKGAEPGPISSGGLLGGLVARPPPDASVQPCGTHLASSDATIRRSSSEVDIAAGCTSGMRGGDGVQVGSGLGLLSGLTLRTQQWQSREESALIRKQQQRVEALIEQPSLPLSLNRTTTSPARAVAPPNADRGSSSEVDGQHLVDAGLHPSSKPPHETTRSSAVSCPPASSEKQADDRTPLTKLTPTHTGVDYSSPGFDESRGAQQLNSSVNSPSADRTCEQPKDEADSIVSEAAHERGHKTSARTTSAAPDVVVVTEESRDDAREENQLEAGAADSGINVGEERSAPQSESSQPSGAASISSSPSAPPSAEEAAMQELSRRQAELSTLRAHTRSLLARRSDAMLASEALDKEVRQTEISQQDASNAEDFEVAEALEEQLEAQKAEQVSSESRLRAIEDELATAEASLLKGCELEIEARQQLILQMDRRRQVEWEELRAMRAKCRQHSSSEKDRIAVEHDRLALDASRLQDDLLSLDGQEQQVHAKIQAGASGEIEARKKWESDQASTRTEIEELRARLAMLEERDAECTAAISACDAKISDVRRGYDKQLSRLQLHRESLDERLRLVESSRQARLCKQRLCADKGSVQTAYSAALSRPTELQDQASELLAARRAARESRQGKRSALLSLRGAFLAAVEGRDQRRNEASQLRGVSMERQRWHALQRQAAEGLTPLRADAGALHDALQQRGAAGLAQQAERTAVRQAIGAAFARQPELLEQASELALGVVPFRSVSSLHDAPAVSLSSSHRSARPVSSTTTRAHFRSRRRCFATARGFTLPVPSRLSAHVGTRVAPLLTRLLTPHIGAHSRSRMPLKLLTLLIWPDLSQKQLAISSRSFKDAGRLTSELKALAAAEAEGREREAELSSFIEANKASALPRIYEAEAELEALQSQTDERLYVELRGLLRTANARGARRVECASDGCELQLIEAHREALEAHARSLVAKLNGEGELTPTTWSDSIEEEGNRSEGSGDGGEAEAGERGPLGSEWDFDSSSEPSEADAEETQAVEGIGEDSSGIYDSQAVEAESNADDGESKGFHEESTAAKVEFTLANEESMAVEGTSEAVEEETKSIDKAIGSPEAEILLENDASAPLDHGASATRGASPQRELSERLADADDEGLSSSPRAREDGQAVELQVQGSQVSEIKQHDDQQQQGEGTDSQQCTNDDGSASMENPSSGVLPSLRAMETTGADDEHTVRSDGVVEDHEHCDVRFDQAEQLAAPFADQANSDEVVAPQEERISALMAICEELNLAIDAACARDNFDEADCLQHDLQVAEAELHELRQD